LNQSQADKSVKNFQQSDMTVGQVGSVVEMERIHAPAEDRPIASHAVH
jgi:hypothetical protein